MAHTIDRSRALTVVLASILAVLMLLALWHALATVARGAREPAHASERSAPSHGAMDPPPAQLTPMAQRAPVAQLAPATPTRNGAGVETADAGADAVALGADPGAAGGDHAPQRVIVLEVVTAHGSPVQQASVSVDRMWFEPSAAPSAFDTLELTTDELGRARFDCLTGLADELGDEPVDSLLARLGLACTAFDGAHLVSPELILVPPVAPGPHLLVFGASIVVTFEVVEGSPPQPVSAAKVRLDRLGRDSRRPMLASTDPRGLATLTELAPGAWEYSVQPAGSEHNVRGELALVAGEERRVTVDLDSSGMRLAVAGRFVDESGAPIEVGRDDHPALWVGCSNGSNGFETSTTPNVDGVFRVYGSCDAEVLVRNFGGHRYEPELARVPFGTRDLVLRRVERFEPRTVVVDARDVADGGALSAAHLTVFEHDARAAQGMSVVKRSASGRLTTTVRARPGTRLAVWADGYAPRFMDLPPSGATADAPLVVFLERGGPRELVVLDGATHRAIAGVELIDARGAVVATTDGVGRAEVRVDHADWLSLRRTGYAEGRFHPSWPWERAYMTRD